MHKSKCCFWLFKNIVSWNHQYVLINKKAPMAAVKWRGITPLTSLDNQNITSWSSVQCGVNKAWLHADANSKLGEFAFVFLGVLGGFSNICPCLPSLIYEYLEHPHPTLCASELLEVVCWAPLAIFFSHYCCWSYFTVVVNQSPLLAGDIFSRLAGKKEILPSSPLWWAGTTTVRARRLQTKSRSPLDLITTRLFNINV